MNHSGQPAANGQAKRRLRFQAFEDVIADVNSLRAGGYMRLGKWSLEQMCFHLGRPISQPLNSVPSPPTPVMQQAVLDRFQYYVDHGHPAPGFTAPPGSEPPEVVEPGTIDDFFARLRSAQAFTGDYVDLGTRGAIPVGLYRPFLLAHCAHHLSFLVPTPNRDLYEYQDLIDEFEHNKISPSDFESRYLDLFKSDNSMRSEEIFDALQSLFSAVDAYCVDPTIRTKDDLDEEQLRAVANRTGLLLRNVGR